MKIKIILLIALALMGLDGQGQYTAQQKIGNLNNYPFAVFFQNAYEQYPAVPKGVLEAVSYTMTRMNHITHQQGDAESCIGLPKIYGVMGLTLDGKNYFKNNLIAVSQLSGYSVNDIINDTQSNILAFAAAYSSIKNQLGIYGNNIEKDILIIKYLSELPDTGVQNDFALNSHIYSVLTFLNDANNQALYSFPNYKIDLEKVFGADNFKVLSSHKVIIGKKKIVSKNGKQYKKNSGNIPNIQSSDYSAALWNPAASCNYTIGRTMAISAVTIHDIEGSYASAISWFQNCSAQVSAHYVIRSSDGQVTQMVLESDKAWHVGSENGYTIGIEHEGYCSQTGWYTNNMYCSSADLVKDICNSGYGISPTTAYSGSACTCSQSSSVCQKSSAIKIKGHQMYQNQTHTDPGINWDWANYYNLINGGSCGNIPPPPNDNCSTSTTLTSNTSCVNTPGTVAGSTSSGLGANNPVFTCGGCSGCTPCGTNYNGVSSSDCDVFYKFQAVLNTHTITVSNLNFDAVLEIRSGCSSGCSNYIGSTDPNGSPATLCLTYNNFQPGQWYYVRVFRWSSSSGCSDPAIPTFNICVTHTGCTPPSAPFTTFGSTSCITSTQASTTQTLTWNAVANAQGYYVAVSRYPYGSANLITLSNNGCVSGLSYTISPALQQGMLYRWNMTANSSIGCTNSACESPFSNTLYFQVPPNITANGATVFCQEGSVILSASPAPTPGGGASMTYQWYQNGNPVGTNSSSYMATQSGDYTLRITYSGSTDCGGNSSTSPSNTVNVIVNSAPFASATTTSHTTCGNNNGSVTATASGGTSPYAYNWSNGCNAATCNNLSAGNYSVTVTGTNGCTAIASTPVNSSTGISVSVSQDNPTQGICNGSATANVTSGNAPYSYQWSIGQTSQTATGLCENTQYTVSVTDANNCTADTTITIVVGLNESYNSSLITIYPNPNSGVFTIENNSALEIEKIEIYNVAGEKVFTMSNAKYQTLNIIDLHSFVTGNYKLMFVTNKGIINKTITVE